MYGRNAEEVKSALLAARPELTVELNPEKPRKKTFEITLLDGGKGEEGRNGKPENNRLDLFSMVMRYLPLRWILMAAI